MIPQGLTHARKNIPLPVVVGAGVAALLLALFAVVTVLSFGAPKQSDASIEVPFK